MQIGGSAPGSNDGASTWGAMKDGAAAGVNV